MPMVSIPFPGNKKYAYKKVRGIFEAGGYDTVLEPFGGSCVLSVNLKRDGLAKKACVNDYDGLFGIYPELLDIRERLCGDLISRGVYPRTHAIRSCGRTGFKYTDASLTEKVPTDSRILEPWECVILQSLVSGIDERFWRPLAMTYQFTHSGVANHKRVRLEDFKYFERCSTMKNHRRFLEALEDCSVDSMDWRDFLETHRPAVEDGKCLVILDPPYFGADNTAYGGGFTEEETRSLLSAMKGYGADFLFFNKDADWMSRALLEAGFGDFEVMPTGNPNQTISRKRRESLAYVRGGANANG